MTSRLQDTHCSQLSYVQDMLTQDATKSKFGVLSIAQQGTHEADIFTVMRRLYCVIFCCIGCQGSAS